MAIHFYEIVEIRGARVQFQDFLDPNTQIAVESSAWGNELQQREFVVRLSDKPRAESAHAFIINGDGHFFIPQPFQHFRHVVLLALPLECYNIDKLCLNKARKCR